ncbi:Uma2 family endonuclease [Dyadobacter sp. LJ53]|uniref:Uma2 family endonuclease n=1 Tax=Dyadobacter chenwenxiniae TaxID=2906456 RepID=UPI001F335212|nr:Uma2 family endonuclease [Dyadobacter chenwenxiniae]MCF0051463.1 Uma2 family endonuclease [Dyadobacter chenwenxiniae]
MKSTETIVWQDWDLSQIINGEEIMSPSPKTPHQKASRKLQRILEDYVDDHNMGEIWNAPMDVIFEENYNRLQPDLIFVPKEKEDIVQDWIRGVPDMVVEIVSKSTIKMDTVVKKEIYERYGVQEYWLLKPEKRILEIYKLVSGRYELHASYGENDVVSSPLFSDLAFKLNIIF